MDLQRAMAICRKITQYTMPSHEQLAAIETLIKYAESKGGSTNRQGDWTIMGDGLHYLRKEPS